MLVSWTIGTYRSKGTHPPLLTYKHQNMQCVRYKIHLITSVHSVMEFDGRKCATAHAETTTRAQHRSGGNGLLRSFNAPTESRAGGD